MKTLTALFVALGVAFSLPAEAQDWPARPVKLIVPTGPGSATDAMARVIANEVSKTIGSAVFVENIAGASGIPAHQATARAEPDGYTFLFTNTSGLALNPVAFSKLPYDPVADFAPVAMVADLGPQMVSVSKDLPVRTLAELIAYSKANPGKVDYGVDVTAGAAPISARLLNTRSGAGMTEVPYRAAAQMMQDVGGGRIPVLISSIAVARPLVDQGSLRPIAVFSARRFPTLPDVPTVAETLPGAVLDGFFAIVAPAKTPANIIAKFNGAIRDFLASPEAPARLANIGLGTSGAGTPASTGEFIAREQALWRDLAKELNIQPQ